MIKIKLSKIEKEILEEVVRENDNNIMYFTHKIEPNNFYIETYENNLTELRECCSDYLMIVGFDNNYKPNDKGNILENLVDKFFIE